MPEKLTKTPRSNNRLTAVLLVLILVNLALTAFGFHLLSNRLESKGAAMITKGELAHDLGDYHAQLATELGVRDEPLVKEALAEYDYVLGLAGGSEDLIRLILNQGRSLTDTIFASSDTLIRERILEVINRDAMVRQVQEKTHLFIRITEGLVTVFPEEVIEAATIRIIGNIVKEYDYPVSQSIDLEIETGAARLVVPQTTEEQTEALTSDLNQVRLKLFETRVQAGLAEMVGPGITLYVYDAESLKDSGSIVHDADIRDIVNELFSAGAKGVSVGGQRLTVTSSIRCSGPLIMVNYQQVSTNPVVIEAVGETDLLISGLSIIVNELEEKRDLLFVVNHSGFIKLAAYTEEE